VIHLDYTPQKISLRVIDDGVGFDPHIRSCLYGGHFGLQDMTERAMKMGAHFNVISAPGQGTEIHIEIREKRDYALATPGSPVSDNLSPVCPPQL
jgi:signal transduction histidine kinase